MSAATIEEITNALGLNAVENLIITSFTGACAAAAYAYTEAPVGEEALPESSRTVMAATTATVIEAA